LAAAVAAALDNVRRHAGAGARAYVLVEDEPDAVTVTVRDDGAGMPAERLAAARADGRLGVAQSIVGRLRSLGGTATVTSLPGEGTEVELRLPRNPRTTQPTDPAGAPGPARTHLAHPSGAADYLPAGDGSGSRG
jgi:signal transduction histidine kinase